MKAAPLLRHSFYLLLVFHFAPSAFSQGILTPPGAPAPTMKSLDQIEARTPISAVPFTINQPGSYYLTKNLNATNGDAITITVDKVTLDLNGFTVSSTASPAAGTGILLSGGRTNITIRNGFVVGGVTQSGGSYSGPGFINGIYISSNPAPDSTNVRVSGVGVSGCLSIGIGFGTGYGTLVESCVVRTVGTIGIAADSVTHCVAVDCGIQAIFASVASDCRGESIGGSSGIEVYTAINCRGSSNSGKGISAATATNCYGFSSLNRGISVEIATGCWGTSGGGSFGLNATYIANNCYGQSGTGTGLASYIAIGCYGINNSGFSVLYTYHYNMPP